MTARSLEEALSALPPERRADVEAQVRRAIFEAAREAFREAAQRCCHEMRNAPPSVGPLGDMRQAYDRMLSAWRESPEAHRERARIDALFANTNEIEW